MLMNTESFRMKEEETNANEYRVLQNEQGNSSQIVVAKDSPDKSFKHRKLVCPAFDENNYRSDFNHQLPCQSLATLKIGNSDSSESGEHGTFIKNDVEQTVNSMMRVPKESANEVFEETMNDILVGTIMADFKRRREKN
ncbi:hypothetical protein H5410_046807 [Solanum commersonii]|uniref:Uncharacterized protein n=1 Tax=Solanum commersonii TaxID=4109 RepID=A0A9J5XFB3_SOLCO|nr:hypothetical protein H5410_046807 [Solanum commersonii]